MEKVEGDGDAASPKNNFDNGVSGDLALDFDEQRKITPSASALKIKVQHQHSGTGAHDVIPESPLHGQRHDSTILTQQQLNKLEIAKKGKKGSPDEDLLGN